MALEQATKEELKILMESLRLMSDEMILDAIQMLRIELELRKERND